MGSRITWDTLESGQPRAYADSRTVVRVRFEIELSTGWTLSKYVKEDYVRKVLKVLHCGFTEFRYPQDCENPAKPSPGEYFTTRLEYLKEIEPGVWEFKTTSAFTD